MMEEGMVIPRLFAHAVSGFPDKTALQAKREGKWLRFSYKQLEENTFKIAGFLVTEGLKKGDKAALIMENRPEWAVIYLGIVHAGCACVPLDVQLSKAEIKNLIADSGAKVVFCSREIFADKIKDNINESLSRAVIFEDMDTGSMTYDKILMPEVMPEDIASLIYTSGTTAKPKGVLLSHANICANYMSIAKLNIAASSDNALSVLPLHHTYAFMVTFIVPLFLGATVTYSPGLKSEEMARVMREGRVTILVGVPQLFSILHGLISERIKKIPSFLLPFILPHIRAKARLRLGGDLRLFVSGGARLAPCIGRELSRFTGIKIIEGYGLTETSPVVTLNPLNKVKFGSCGRPIPGVEVKIIGPDNTGTGEVLIKGPNLMRGYFKHEDWTRSVIKDGWFYSGDLGYMDKENYLFLVGRKKEVIVLSSGKNIYPEELEQYYAGSPYIKEICVIQRREERPGGPVEALHAVVVPDLEYFRQKNESNIRSRIRWEMENCSRDMPSYKRVMGFTITKEELPRTALRKIKRYAVKEKYLYSAAQDEMRGAPSAEDDNDIVRKDIAEKVINYISGQLKRPVYPRSHLEIDLGIDSLTKVELGLGLEGVLNIKIPEEVLYGASTVKELILGVSALFGDKRTQDSPAGGTGVEWGKILLSAEEDLIKGIKIKPSLPDRLAAWALKIIFLSVFRVFWFLRIKGADNLPAHGPYLICPNHSSYLDGFIVFSSLPARDAAEVFFLGYSDILEHPLIKPTTKAARLIPVDPDTNLVRALKAVSFVLAKKKIACIFPEGRRSVDENTAEFKKGVGILIKELNIPVIPAYIKGSYRSWPRGKKLPRLCPLKIVFGRPFLAAELMERGIAGKDDYETIAVNLREEVMKLAC
ncbi:MAG: AMP-binding protein [Candidatus Omnitrophota bacterium]|jgi:long-chain acyl-CoA synthetase